MRSVPSALVLLAAGAVAMSSCAPADEEVAEPAATDAAAPSAGSATAQECSPESLQTQTPGTLTVATDQPAYEPWFVDDDPSNGQGFESAVAYAVAEELGYQPGDVEWTRVRFDAAIQPGPKDFDVDINQFSITEERREAVDFSAPYYDVTQTVITTAGSPASGATSLEDLRDLRLGAQVGTTSYDAIVETVQPTTQPAVFNTNDDAKAALQNGQIDALVVDLPTAFFITAAELDDGEIVGQLPSGGGEPEQFGMVLDKGSPITDCVSAAVEALRADGTLAALEEEWLSQAGGAPVLE